MLLVSGVVAVIGDTAAGAGSAAAAGGAAAAARPKDGTNSVAFTFRADNLELTSSILVRITFPYSRRTKGEREKKRNENKKREREKNSSGHVSLFLSFRNVSFFFSFPPEKTWVLKNSLDGTGHPAADADGQGRHDTWSGDNGPLRDRRLPLDRSSYFSFSPTFSFYFPIPVQSWFVDELVSK